MALLGLDFGTKRIGLATEIAGIAMPVSDIATHTALDDLEKIVAERKITGFVIGLPNHADGRESKETRLMRKFSAKLKERFPNVPVHEQDERFSSSAAYFSLEEAGIGRKEAGRVDAMAASIILQDYLDSH